MVYQFLHILQTQASQFANVLYTKTLLAHLAGGFECLAFFAFLQPFCQPFLLSFFPRCHYDRFRCPIIQQVGFIRGVLFAVEISQFCGVKRFFKNRFFRDLKNLLPVGLRQYCEILAMPGTEQLKMPLVNGQNALDTQAFRHCGNRTVHKINPAVSVLLQDFRGTL